MRNWKITLTHSEDNIAHEFEYDNLEFTSDYTSEHGGGIQIKAYNANPKAEQSRLDLALHSLYIAIKKWSGKNNGK